MTPTGQIPLTRSPPSGKLRSHALAMFGGLLNSEVTVLERGRERKLRGGAAILLMLRNRALNGDDQAARTYLRFQMDYDRRNPPGLRPEDLEEDERKREMAEKLVAMINDDMDFMEELRSQGIVENGKIADWVDEIATKRIQEEQTRLKREILGPSFKGGDETK